MNEARVAVSYFQESNARLRREIEVLTAQRDAIVACAYKHGLNIDMVFMDPCFGQTADETHDSKPA